MPERKVRDENTTACDFFFVLTKWGGVRPDALLGAPDDGLADEHESLVADVLHRVAHEEAAAVQEATVVRRQGSGTAYG